MSKNTVNAKTARDHGVSKMLQHLARVSAAKVVKLSKIPGVIPCVCFVLMLLSWLLIDTAAGLSVAMLYSFPDNRGISGRAGAWVYMRNGRIRRFAVPSLVSNVYTLTARALLSNLSSGWEGLTDSERLTWINSLGFSHTDRFGNPKAIKGKNLFVELNANLINTANTPINVAPLHAAVPGVTDGTLTVSVAVVSFAFSPTPTDLGVDHLVFATTTLAAGVSRPSASAFRVISVFSAGGASPMVLSTPYIAKFGAPILGGRVFIKVVPINKLTGQAGSGFGTSAIVA